tara:strand:- start:506 stop:694 length:189 start_codon:yes stop_codon:yes gene_type:complete
MQRGIRMSESKQRYVILLEFVDGRRDVSELLYDNRNDAERHAMELENTDEVLFTMIRRAVLV